MSDVVHFNSHTNNKITNIDDLVMGKAGKSRRYYGGIGIKNMHLRERHKLIFTDISIRDVVLHLGNYSRVWEQLVSVYPRVNIIQTTIVFFMAITINRSKYYFSMETGSQKSL